MTSAEKAALRVGSPSVPRTEPGHPSLSRLLFLFALPLALAVIVALGSWTGMLGGKQGLLGGRGGPLFHYQGAIGGLVLGSYALLGGILVTTGVTAWRTRGWERRYWRDTLYAYLLISPAALVIVIFTLISLIYAFYVSLHRFGLGEISGFRAPDFIGLRNYAEATVVPGSRSTEFWKSLANTFWLTLGSIPFQIVLALVIAVLLFRKMRGVDFYRTSFFLPYVTATIALAQVWVVLFSRGEVGLVNNILQNVFGLPRQGWLMEARSILDILTAGAITWGPSQALVVIMMYSVWKYFGFSVVILLAGLANISREVYEAAEIDGANAWQSFRRITIPLLSPSLYYVTLISSIGSLRSFDTIYQLSIRASGGSGPGGPLDTTQTLVIYVFNQFWRDSFYGYGSALAMILFAVILIITLIQQRVASRQVFYA
jgi:multiple sugar transport system permease protein